jgi:hypothetical protein
MVVELAISNYRAFGRDAPARFALRRGVTALTGQNNAGKSMLLRFFYEFRPLFAELARLELPENNTMERPCPPPRDVADRDSVFHRHDPGPLVLGFDYGAGPAAVVIDRRTFHYRVTAPGSEVWEELRPVFASLERALFFGPHRSLQQGSPIPGQDARSGLEFAARWREAKEKHPERVRGLLEEIGEDLCRLFQFREFHADVDDDGRVEFRVDGERLGLPELGSGISQAFLLLAQVAAQEPDYVLIDEPECHLHPACQVDFVTLLGNHARFGVIAATHNMGLARSISEHIYEIRRAPGGRASRLELLEQEDTRLSQTLGEMDFAAHRRMGCTKVLLVEGPTEVKAVRQLLAKRGDGRSVVLLPLGGSSMINGRRADELGEIRKICPNVYALIDSERGSPGDPVSIPHQEFLEACQRHGIDAHALERRSFENYLGNEAVRKVLGRPYRALKPYEDVKRAFSRWPKSENWRIVRAMRLEDFVDTDLLGFVDHVLGDPCRTTEASDGPAGDTSYT